MPSLAQKLRAEPTISERRLWRLIQPFRTNGFHFRKQVALGRYIADFACLHAQLVIEVDGDTHHTEAGLAADTIRDAYLRTRGFTVLRFTNHEVATNPDGVYTVTANVLANHAPRVRTTASDAKPAAE